MVKPGMKGALRRQHFSRGSTIQELFRPRRLAWAVAGAYGALLAGGAAWGNPSGGTVVNGQATFSHNGQTLTVANTPGAIINWQSFSIGTGETTNFIQQSVNSAVLNRVISQDPSKILGTLSSNGRVFLINPNGIVFGQGSVVDTAGLVASTLDITDDDFKSGRMRFVGSGASGDIKVAGVIRSTSGDIYLIAPNIQNDGAIKAENGEAILAAGESVEILGRGLDNIRFEVQNAGNQAVNLGSIEGDAVGLFAGTLRQAGVVQANALSVEGGKVVLRALGDVTLASGGVTTADHANGSGGSVTVQSQTGNLSVEQGALVSASGRQGGTVTLQADLGTNAISGSVKATGTLSLSGEGEAQGGLIRLLGRQVGLFDAALADASGDTGGGTVLVGGDWQGANPDVQNAAATYVGVNAVIKVDANLSGDGGKAVVWSDGTTRMHGQILARGGIDGGNGGLVETSGKDYLQVTRSPEFYARGEGVGGTWLIDPSTINITTVTNNVTGFGNEFDPFVGTTDVSELDVNILTGALDNGGTVVVDTSSAAAGAGDINVMVDVVFNGTADATLKLLAHNDVNVDADITNASTSRLLHISLVGDQDLDGGGGVNIATGVTLTTLGGDFDAVGEFFFSNGTVDTSGRAGQNAGSIQVYTNSSGAFGTDSINTGTLLAVGGDGSDGIGTSGNSGGAGGLIDLYAQSGDIRITGALRTGGGQGGDATDAGFGDNAGSGGAGGAIQIHAADGNVTVDAALPDSVANGEVLFANGGDGGNASNTTGTAGVAGGAGGDGGALSIQASGAIDLIFNSQGSLIAQGGHGGSGSSSTNNAGSGGGGGWGGAINFTTLSGAISLENALIQGAGGAGGDGGDGELGTTANGGAGGAGGLGGGIQIQSGGAFSATGTTLFSSGLDGGDGGDADQGNAGNGGAGGGGASIYISASGLVDISTSFIAPYTSGGAGGNGGNSLAGWGGDGGAGGNGGWIDIYSGAVVVTGIVIDQDSFLGGVAGAGGHGGNGVVGGEGGDGGWGGAISLEAYVGALIIDNSSLTSQGGDGGKGGDGTAANATDPYRGGDGGSGGDAGYIELYASTSDSINGSLATLGGWGGAGGNATDPNLLNPTGYAGYGGWGGDVGGWFSGGQAIGIYADGGDVTLSGSFQAIGGGGGNGGALTEGVGGVGADGGAGGWTGYIHLYAPDGSVILEGATVHGQGGDGGMGSDSTGYADTVNGFYSEVGDGGAGGNFSGIEILAFEGGFSMDAASSLAAVGGNGGDGGSFSALLADAGNFTNSMGGSGGSVDLFVISVLNDVDIDGDLTKRSGDGGVHGSEVSDGINGTLLPLGFQANAGDLGGMQINSSTGSIHFNAGMLDFATGYGDNTFSGWIEIIADAGDITQEATHGIGSSTGSAPAVDFYAPGGAVDLDSSANMMGAIEGEALNDITIINGTNLSVFGLDSTQGNILLRMENSSELNVVGSIVTGDGWIKFETDALTVSGLSPQIAATEFIKVAPINASAVTLTPDGSGGELILIDAFFLVLELELPPPTLVLDGAFFEAIDTPLLIVDAGPDVDISILSTSGGSIDISSTTLEMIANNITQQSDTEINVDGLNVSAIGSASLIAFGNSVFGPIKADTGDDFTLYGESQFNITGVTSGGDVDIENTYNDGTGIAVHGGMSAAGNMRLATPGDIEIGTGAALAVSASNLELVGFDILQDSAAVLDVGGLNVSAVGDAYLTTAGNMVTGPITADTGGDFKLYGASAFAIDAVSSGGDVELVNNGTGVGINVEGNMSAAGNMLLDTDGDIVIGGSGIGALTVAASALDLFANNISQASDTELDVGPLNVSAIGAASLAAFGNSVFGPIQAYTGDDFTLYGDSMFNVSSVTAGGDVDIETTYNDGTAIQVDGDVIAGGTLRLAGAGDVVIGGSGIAPLVHGPGDVNITGFNVHVFGTVQSDNTLSVDAAGDLLVAGSDSVTGVSGELLSVFDMFLDVGGTFTIQGGAADDAHATVDPSSSGTLFVNAGAIQLLGGSGLNAWAALLSSGDIDFVSSGSLTLQQGSGGNADAVVVALGSTLNIPDSCTGCLNLDDIDPLANPQTQQGIYGLTPDLPIDIIQEIITLLKLKDPPDDNEDDNDADIVVEGGGDACK